MTVTDDVHQGYLEEEVRRANPSSKGRKVELTRRIQPAELKAVITYTRCLQDLANGYLPEWTSTKGTSLLSLDGPRRLGLTLLPRALFPAPQIAVSYCAPGARAARRSIADLVLRATTPRADEGWRDGPRHGQVRPRG